MKTSRSLWIVLALVCLLVCVALLFHHTKPESPVTTLASLAPQGSTRMTNVSMPSNRVSRLPSLATRAADMTEEEKAKLNRDFHERYKPIVAKWFKAYEGRIPFAEEDFTLDKFHSRFGDYMFTFMIGDTTFTIQDSKLGLKVSYLMVRKAAIDMNRLPHDGSQPDLSVPITAEEVIGMVKADSGVEFKRSEIIIRPTGAACALGGGAFVEVVPNGADPGNGLNSKVSLVIGPDGKLLTYERNPLF